VRKLVARVGGSRPDQAPAGVAGVATAPAAAGALPVVAAGLGFLLLRPQVAALPLGRPALAAGYLALGLAAAGAPAALRRRRPPGGTAARPAVPAGPLPWPLVLVTGLAAIAGVALLSGPVPAVPADAGAVLLGLAAAVAEEALFRQAMYRTLAARGGAVLAVTATAVAFALVHLPFYGMAAFPVDLGAGLLFGWQRWSSGSWTVPAATHAAANLMVVIPLG
jgi:membrane protease YdiL (CAAX protease family)